MTKSKKTEAPPKPDRLAQFHPQRQNANKHKPHGLTALANSIQRDGYSAPMVAAADGEVFAGSARLEKSTELFGVEVEPIIVHSDGTRPIIHVRDDIPNADDARAKRLGVADNLIGVMDYEPDGAVLALLAAADDAIAQMVKQEDVSLAAVLKAANDAGQGEAEPQIDRAEELREKWQTSSGQLWQIGQHRLLCGDSTKREDVERVMQREKADLVLTDPPYSVDYVAKNRALQTIGRSNLLTTDIEGDTLSTQETADTIWKPSFENAYNVSRNGTVIYCFSPQGGDQMMMMMMIRAQWNDRLHQLIWRKNSPTFSMGRLDYQYQHEPILYTWRGTNHGYYGEIGRSVIDIDRPSESKLHPTMKPVELFQLLIGNSSKDSELVYEPFAGSGTTLVACHNLNRKCRAIEISPAYCGVILQRMSDAFPGLEIVKL